MKRPDLDPDKVLSSPVHADRWEADYRRTKIQNERSFMQTNVRALVNAINAQGGLNSLADKEMPPKLAYRFGRLLDSATSAAKAAQKHRRDLFEKYGTPVFSTPVPGPEGTQPERREIVSLDDQKAFTAEMDDYLDGTMIDIWYEPTKLSELEMCGIKLTPADMVAIGPFIDTEDGSEK